MQPPSDTASGAASELRADTKHVASSAVNRLHSELDARKGTAATQVKSVSSAIERTAGDLGDDAPAWLLSTFRQGAQQVQRFADALEQKDTRQLVDEVSNFARNSPGTFLAGCAAAGFAAARIFKAGGSAATQGVSQPGSTGGNFAQDSAFPNPGAGAESAPFPRGEFV